MVWAAVRPEKINILRQQPADISENCVKGVVKEIAYMGDVSIYLVKIDTGKTVRVTLPNVERLSDDERILWDETVWLTWHAIEPRGRDAMKRARGLNRETSRRPNSGIEDSTRAVGSAVDVPVPLRAAALVGVRAAELVRASAWSSRCPTCGC